MTLIDECDELTQGKGNKSLNVPHREDPGTYQQYVSEDARGEDEEDDDIPPFDPGGRRASRGSRKENIAAATSLKLNFLSGHRCHVRQRSVAIC